MTQERCCCICDGTYSNVARNLQSPVKPREKKTLLQACILSQLKKLDESIKAKEIRVFDCRSAEKMIEGIEFIETAADLLGTFLASGMKFAHLLYIYIYIYIFIYNCRQYCFGLLGLISAVLNL